MQNENNNGEASAADKVAASFFGRLQIVYKGITLNEDAIHSEMVTKLLAYILMHRERTLSVRELSETLWNSDEASDNPSGALKNLMYRLRNILKKSFGDQPFVLTSLGSYYWNPDLPAALDIEDFETMCNAAKASENRDEKICCYEAALELYQGQFLANYTSEHWVVPVSTYYHSLFLSGVKALAELYEKDERYEEMERICSQAIKYDNLDEELHYLMLKSLVYQQKQKLALEHYESTVKLFYDSLGIRNLPKLKEIHKEILSMKKTSKAAEIMEINQDMREEEAPDGAFICGYAIFQEIYRIEARRISRMGMSEYVLLLTLSLQQEGTLTETAMYYLLNRAMDRLEDALKRSLRIGDVAARYSDTQYVVMLPACTYEAGQKVANRVIGRFKKDVKNKNYTVTFDIEEVTMAESKWME